MPLALHTKPLAGTHHRVWLIIAAIVVFLMVALWAQPIG